MMTTSIKTRLKAATSEKELSDIISEAKTFEFASSKTKRSWVRTLDLRKTELKKSSETSAEDTSDKKKTKKKVKSS